MTEEGALTALEVYDLAVRDYEDPAVYKQGEECVLGYWALFDEKAACVYVLRSGDRGVVVVAKAKTWADVARMAGL